MESYDNPPIGDQSEPSPPATPPMNHRDAITGDLSESSPPATPPPNDTDPPPAAPTGDLSEPLLLAASTLNDPPPAAPTGDLSELLPLALNDPPPAAPTGDLSPNDDLAVSTGDLGEPITPLDNDPPALEHEYDIIQIDKEVTLVLAGKCGAGKSTLKTNILKQEDDFEMSPESITKEINEDTFEKNGITIKTIDTPGLEKTKKMKKQQLKKISKRDSNIDFILFCVPVSPGSKFIDDNPEIMKSLQEAFGKAIWKRCVLVFTFSNLAWDRCRRSEDPVNKYQKYMRDYAEKFQKELTKTLGVKDAKVKMIFDCTAREEDEDVIYAFPAGDLPTDEILPGMETTWSDEIFGEIIIRSQLPSQLAFLQYQLGLNRMVDILNSALRSELSGEQLVMLTAGGGGAVSVTAAAGGAVIGAGIGAGIGAVTTGPFAPIGAVIGGVSGATIAGVAVGITAGITAFNFVRQPKGT